MGDRRVYADDDEQLFYYDEEGNPAYISPKTNRRVYVNIAVAVITAIGGIVASIIGATPGPSGLPRVCEISGAPIINSIINCNGSVELAVSASLTAVAPISVESSPRSSGEIEVKANEQWQATDVFLQPGDILSVTYVQGTWSGRIEDGESSWVRPGGNGPGDQYDCIPIPQHDQPGQPGTGPNALIGRIASDGEIFTILTYTNPNQFSDVINVSGELYLQMNDCSQFFHDNAGSILVRVEIG